MLCFSITLRLRTWLTNKLNKQWRWLCWTKNSKTQLFCRNRQINPRFLKITRQNKLKTYQSQSKMSKTNRNSKIWAKTSQICQNWTKPLRKAPNAAPERIDRPIRPKNHQVSQKATFAPARTRTTKTQLLHMVLLLKLTCSILLIMRLGWKLLKTHIYCCRRKFDKLLGWKRKF